MLRVYMGENEMKIDLGSLPVFLLGVLFVGLKLTGYIDWSWWWVTLPFWIGLAIVSFVIAVLAVLKLLTR